MNAMKLNPRRSLKGFTLPETLIAMTIGSFVIAGMMTLYVEFMWSYRDTTSLRNTSSRASLALERIVHGVGGNAGLLEATASSVTVTYPSSGWRCAYTNSLSASPNPLFFQYAQATQLITNESGKTICSGVITSSFACTTALGGATNGCTISVTVSESSGGRISTNVMTTFVQFRNQ